MVDLIVLPAAAAAGSAADGLRHDDELIERGPASRPRRVAAAPRAGAVAAPRCARHRGYGTDPRVV